MPIMILTARLQLIPVDRKHIHAFQQGGDALTALLGASIPAAWPHFPQAFAIPADDNPAFIQASLHWYGYLFVDHAQRALVGNGGFKGPPNADGVVEIGYEIAPSFQNSGYATEAAEAMITFAFAVESVNAVAAHTLGAVNASNRVLQKVAMRHISDVEHPGLGTLWAWQRARN